MIRISYIGEGNGWKQGCEIILIDLNPTYVVAKFELAKCFVGKGDQGQRLCTSVNTQILEDYPRAGKQMGRVCECVW